MVALSMRLLRFTPAWSIIVLACLPMCAASAATYTSFANFNAATTSTTTEDFEASVWDNTFSEPQVNLGVSWTSPETSGNLLTVALAHSGTRSLFDGGSDPALSFIAATLPIATTATGGWILSEGQVVLTAFGSEDDVLATVSNSSGGLDQSFVFLGVTTGEDISRIELRSDESGSSAMDAEFVLDDFVFGSAVVIPEPSALFLCLMGIAVAAIARLRVRKKRTLRV